MYIGGCGGDALVGEVAVKEGFPIALCRWRYGSHEGAAFWEVSRRVVGKEQLDGGALRIASVERAAYDGLAEHRIIKGGGNDRCVHQPIAAVVEVGRVVDISTPWVDVDTSLTIAIDGVLRNAVS